MINKILNSKWNKERRYYSTNNSEISTKFFQHLSKKLWLTTIAFNKPELVSLQIKLLKRHLGDKFYYLVCDNSNDVLASKDIRKLCNINSIPYIKLPASICSEHPSRSHGYAINWAYINIMNKFKPEYFGIIDHDIFPVKNSTIMDRLLSQPFYGVKETKEDSWYLWAGFCFFNTSFLRHKKVDFLPVEGLDTGGAMWQTVYSKMDQNNIVFPKRVNCILGGGNNLQKDSYQKIDATWAHMVNGSNWANVEDMSKKEEWLRNLASIC